ncbi:efflux transporter, RND family, MFP subunit [Desulfovibrio sp. X2]|uniref:efflux RND transporter periplasmic adaptor subunit n=1 Tax=Desulfovibrio sp. X2 TaxID=941449 RepID=UPI000358EBEE|nr:efflux RND transporter periplasmic adaptor subunit [Desulfovibrio sp. X2]EPR36355.1 efflux transporter, RND family, MFP subunit [Desulfovibrio sp. X2]
MRKWLVSAVVLAVLAAGGLLAYRSLYGQTNPAAQYVTAPVTRGDIASTVTSTGTLNPVTTVQVGTPVSGIVKALYVDYNSPVRTGQPIAQIDPAIFKALVEQAHGNYLAALANVDKAKAGLEDAERTLKRYKALVGPGLIAQSDYDTAQTARDTAAAALSAARAAVVQTRGAFQQAETNLAYSTIRSPVDGIVVSRDVDVGQTVAASLQSPTLFLIAQDLTKMEVDASVDEADIGSIREGGTATFTVDAYPDDRFHGKVLQVRNSPVTVQNVVTYVVVIGVDNTDLRLKPGMTANVTFETARKEGVLKIPAAALRFRPLDAGDRSGRRASGRSVYVLAPDGRLTAVPVATGIFGDSEVEVTGGKLSDGQKVVVEQTGPRKPGGTGASGGGHGSPFGARL